ncbi:MAG: hypothetical protein JXA64_04070 [Candidatus Fermentibacteraceae bacterium]|nr:hypothetical protein [Candidatus Fermentibacteraceae bacterium]MBN2608268.1 hypothetical protein [Candidatus Fermentibacteraceae bacterium]
MRSVLSILLAVVLTACCAREAGRDLMTEEEIDRIRADLAAETCRARMDSLCFEIDGIIYEASLENGLENISGLLPDTLPVCPLSGLEYVVTETADDLTVTCPSGHGSQTVPK